MFQSKLKGCVLDFLIHFYLFCTISFKCIKIRMYIKVGRLHTTVSCINYGKKLIVDQKIISKSRKRFLSNFYNILRKFKKPQTFFLNFRKQVITLGRFKVQQTF